jgi:hypothetical protein
MSSIITRAGCTFHGVSVTTKPPPSFHGKGVFGRGVFTDEDGKTYAGKHRDGYACGLGVLTWPNGTKEFAEHSRDGYYSGMLGPDGCYAGGRHLRRSADGSTWYGLYERGEWKWVEMGYPCWYNTVTGEQLLATGFYQHMRGKLKDWTRVYADGTCEYNNKNCAPDDPRLLALIAQVAPIEV